MENKVFAIDCGGTNLRVGVVDSNLNIIKQISIPSTKNNPDKLFLDIKNNILVLSNELNVKVTDIGFSICGIVSDNNVGRCGNLGIEKGYDFYNKLKIDFPLAKVTIANDGNSSSLAEAIYGVNKNYNSSIFITISSGIGIGVVLNNKMISTPLEGGRLITNYKDNENEIEYFISGNGLVHLAEINNLKIQDAKEFFTLVNDKNNTALKIFKDWKNMVANFIVNLQLLFNVEGYALSGGVLKQDKLFLKDIESLAQEKIAKWHLNKINLQKAHFNQDVGLIAGATLALNNNE